MTEAWAWPESAPEGTEGTDGEIGWRGLADAWIASIRNWTFRAVGMNSGVGEVVAAGSAAAARRACTPRENEAATVQMRVGFMA